MYDQIYIAPVNTEIECRGADHSFQLVVGHGLFDLPALGHVEGAVMQGNRQIVVVDRPQFLKQDFRLRTRVDKGQRHAGLFDLCVNILGGVARGMARPWHTLF